ncbi:Maf family protein, partial [Acinetobacter baumannii]
MLLEWAEIPNEIMVIPTDETFSMEIPIAEIPIHIAKQKLEAVREKVEGARIILAADTIVVLKDEVLNKPAHKEEAIDMLTKLSGK